MCGRSSLSFLLSDGRMIFLLMSVRLSGLVCLQANCIIRVSSILLESVLVVSLDTYLFFYLQYSTCTFTFTIYEGLIQSQKPQKMIAAQLHVPFKIILILYTHVILKLNVDP